MGSKINRDLVKTTEAIAKNFGIKYCTQCHLTRPIEGGRVFTLANGRTRWKCAVCFKKQKPSGVF